MTEREKMLSQRLYYASRDEGLLRERAAAKALCQAYNRLAPDDVPGQMQLMKKLLGRTGEQLTIMAPFWCDYGWNIEIGENFFANHNTVILDCARVRFGDNVFIGPGCGFHTAGHPIDRRRRTAGLEYARPITVGSDVWIGAGVQVLPGVSIGDGAVIGAGSVVTRDIPADVVAAGSPCRVLRAVTAHDAETEWDGL